METSKTNEECSFLNKNEVLLPETEQSKMLNKDIFLDYKSDLTDHMSVDVPGRMHLNSFSHRNSGSSFTSPLIITKTNNMEKSDSKIFGNNSIQISSYSGSPRTESNMRSTVNGNKRLSFSANTPSFNANNKYNLECSPLHSILPPSAIPLSNIDLPNFENKKTLTSSRKNSFICNSFMSPIMLPALMLPTPSLLPKLGTDLSVNNIDFLGTANVFQTPVDIYNSGNAIRKNSTDKINRLPSMCLPDDLNRKSQSSIRMLSAEENHSNENSIFSPQLNVHKENLNFAKDHKDNNINNLKDSTNVKILYKTEIALSPEHILSDNQSPKRLEYNKSVINPVTSNFKIEEKKKQSSISKQLSAQKVEKLDSAKTSTSSKNKLSLKNILNATEELIKKDSSGSNKTLATPRINNRQRFGSSCNFCQLKKCKCDSIIDILVENDKIFKYDIYNDNGAKSLDNNNITKKKLKQNLKVHYKLELNDPEILQRLKNWLAVNNLSLPAEVKSKDFTDQNISYYKHLNKIIQVRPCNNCVLANMSCNFQYGYSKEDKRLCYKLRLKTKKKQTKEEKEYFQNKDLSGLPKESCSLAKVTLSEYYNLLGL
ncbi:hypothetical protein QEN19_000398 [Hanseniaspora menglaensis]